MHVLVGGIHQEANTFSGIKTVYTDFRRYHGQELFDCLPQCRLFDEAGISVIPAVFATAIPSAPLCQEEFDKFTADFFETCDDSKTPDAIYLCLHGAMYIQGAGSGELYFVKKLRRRYGQEIPIFASFDFHGNMFPELAAELNYVTAYKTAPHVDEAATRERAVRALIDCMKRGRFPRVKCIQIPMTFPGEMVITKQSPSREILSCVEEMAAEGLAMEASWFCGFIWSDAPEIFMSVAVSALDFSRELEKRLDQAAAYIWSLRTQFQFQVPALEVPEALLLVMDKSREQRRIFLSDSGDNVTAGASGDNAYMAGEILHFVREHSEYCGRKILVTGIADKAAVEYCMQRKVGERVTISLGKTLDPASTRIEEEFTVVKKGTIPAGRSSEAMKYVMVRQGNVDILLNELRFAYTDMKHFHDVGVLPTEYHVICVKLGYLYPQLAEIANGSVLAFSPGNAPLKPEMIPYSSGRKDFYPLADVRFDGSEEARTIQTMVS